jgi:hypothetical protein
MTTATFAQRINVSHFIGSVQPIADLCIIEVTPRAAKAVCALADVHRITVPDAAAGVVSIGIVVRDKNERLGRVRILRADDAPALRDALDRQQNPSAIIALGGVFLSSQTQCWKIEDAEITIAGNDPGAAVRWSGLLEGEGAHFKVEFTLGFFAQVW